MAHKSDTLQAMKCSKYVTEINGCIALHFS